MVRSTFLLFLLLSVHFLETPQPIYADTAFTHAVAWGETLYSIARLYDTTPPEIARANGMDNNAWLYAGQRLTIPRSIRPDDSPIITPSGYYTIRAGDTLSSIAARFGIDVELLASANELPSNGLIYIGWTLKIPRASASAESEAMGAASTYIVQRGDSLTAIAFRYGTSIQAIAIANSLPNYWLIYAGQRLKIPRAPPARATTISSTNETRVPNIPLYRQQQTLTCEEAAAAMATRGAVSEAQLLAVMPRSDNPFLGIRGRTNSPYLGGLMDYGVYAPALQKGLSARGVNSQLLYAQKYDDFKNDLLTHLRAGRPVIWWHTWQDSYQTPVSVRMAGGATVKLVPYEHTSVIVGANDRGVITHDPYDASVRLVSWNDFRRESEYFDNMALVIQ